MNTGLPGPFGAQLKALREASGFTQEELATIAGLSVHAISALERGLRRRPHVDTVRALVAALDLSAATRDTLLSNARARVASAAADELSGASLPVALTALIGRDADLQTLGHWLADPAARLITLTGPGGSGKTRLALELARSIADANVARVAFAPLAGIREATFVGPAITEALGLSDATPGDLPQRARIACQGRPTLLVLDNFEQVLDAAPLAADLLASVETLRLLVTSRAPLRIRGEREFVVGPLGLAADPGRGMSPADLARAPAVRVFLERVRDVQPGFRLTPANGPTITAICRRLDGLPLALELAAPWMKVLTAEDLERRLAHDVLLSTAARRDLPERQQTMSATVAWSYQLLGPDEKRAFRRLGAMPGRFPIEAAAAVLAGRNHASASLEDALSATASLIDKSLLVRAETSLPDRPLYQMLETVRAYAALELASAGERDDAVEGLVRYSVTQASRAGAELVGLAQSEWLERVRDELELYRATLAWLLDHGSAAEASGVASGLLFFWLIRGHAAEGLRWYEQILAAASLPPAAESAALLGTAVLAHTQGQVARARDGVTRALSLAHDAGAREIAVQAENLLGHVEQADGNLAGARNWFARSIDGFRALDLPWGTGNAIIGMASGSLAAGDVPEAERLLDEATSVLQSAGPWFQNLPLYIRAILAVQRGAADEAIALVRQSVTRSRELHDRFAFVYALIPLASAAVLKGDDAWAARILGARDSVTERSGSTRLDRSLQGLRDDAERQAQSRLGPNRWARAYAAGRTASIDSLLEDIDTSR